uniref:3,4-dihydroxy-2-butanone 4-phosphate synthase n=1 Tax=Chrysotila carterae TaxID=13221 RepID=A0A7S4ERD9_CHRCT
MAAGGAAEETAMTAQAQAEAAQAQAERAQTQAELALSQAEAAKLQAEAAQAQLGHRQLTTALAGRALPEPFGRESVIAAIEEIKAGRPIVVTDDESRENEGDLIMAAQHATQEWIAFIVRYSSGVICASLPGSRLDELQLPPMVINNEDPKQTAFCVTVDLKGGTTTGISAADRAATFRALADPNSKPSDFNRPGHVFPLRPRDGGVLERDGHTEATLDLVKLAGLDPCGILCEVVNDDGTMSRVPDLIPFCKRHGLVLTSIADLIAYRKEIGQ